MTRVAAALLQFVTRQLIKYLIPDTRTILHQVLPWILPRRLHDTLLLVADRDGDKKVRALRWLLRFAVQQRTEGVAGRSSLSRQLAALNGQHAETLLHLASLQHSLNSLLYQSRQQQEDQMTMERKLIEMKFGVDPLQMSSDSLLWDDHLQQPAEDNDSSFRDIHMQEIAMEASAANSQKARPLVAPRHGSYW